MSKTRVLRSRCVLLPDQVRAADVVIEDGHIVEVAAYGSRCERASEPLRDLGELLLMSSLIDPHVHINEPGRTHWEGFETATRAAAAGGITTLIDMPLNSSPVTTTAQGLEEKRRAALGQCWVDVGFYGGLVPTSANADGMKESFLDLLESGIFGVKAFLCDSGLGEFPAVGERELDLIMPYLEEAGLPLLVHAELFDDLSGAASASLRDAGPQRRYADYAASRPPSVEVAAIRLLAELSQRHGCAVHIVHLATAEAVSLLEEARRGGVKIGVETCPHYLLFSSDQIQTGDTRFLCAPPIRDPDNRSGLRRALESGTIDWVGSDHSPCPPERKLMDRESAGWGDFSSAWGGIASLQLLLPATWTAARSMDAGVADLSRWLSGEPARRLGLFERNGAIEAGFAADLVAWDPDRGFVVDGARLFHRHPLTPYDGMRLFGTVEATWLRGVEVFDRGRHVGAPRGRLLERPRDRRDNS